ELQFAGSDYCRLQRFLQLLAQVCQSLTLAFFDEEWVCRKEALSRHGANEFQRNIGIDARQTGPLRESAENTPADVPHRLFHFSILQSHARQRSKEERVAQERRDRWKRRSERIVASPGTLRQDLEAFVVLQRCDDGGNDENQRVIVHAETQQNLALPG